mgnify:CR=1 FL=1
MDIYVCNGKEKQGNITNYFLSNVKNNRKEVVTSDKLKNAIRNKRVDVMNLTLTSDGRLVEASKDKIAQLSGILKAPSSIRGELNPLDTLVLDQVEDLMDEIIKDCLQSYLKEYSKYVKIKNINKDNNTFILGFTLGLNSYVTCQYDKVVYGRLGEKPHGDYSWVQELNQRDKYGVCFDIQIQVLGISNRKTSAKIGDGEVLKASKLYNKDCIILSVESNNKNKIDYKDDDIAFLKINLGSYLLRYICRELATVCKNNPDIANNTNLDEYIKYDERKKEYIKTASITVGLNLGGAVVLGSLASALLLINPEIIQQGLLSGLIKSGTTSQILAATWTCSGAIGLGVGGYGMYHMNKKEDFGFMLRVAKHDYENIKKHIEKDRVPIVGKRKLD